jgi:RNA polymerase sigma-70 factor (ECF subfamily)
MNESPPPGSTTLLHRLSLCPTDADVWNLFVQRYSGVIYGWCCRCGLQDADARDVNQNVFAALLRGLPHFDRSRGRFRNYLYRIVQNGVRDWCSDPAQRQEKGTEVARQRLASEQARRDLEARLNEEFDLERLDIAEKNVRLLVAPHCWDAYRLRCKEGLSLRQAANQIGIPAGHVSKYALRVRDMVARQVTLLDEPLEQGKERETESQHEQLPAAGNLAEIPAGPAEPRSGPRPYRPRPGLSEL